MNEKEGYLEKEGGTVKSWKTRWFVLNQNLIIYYKNRKETSKPLGIIEIQNSQIIVVDDYYRKKKLEFLFQIKSPKRTFNIIAPDFDTRQSWVDLILSKLPNQTEPIHQNFNSIQNDPVDLDHDIDSEPETNPLTVSQEISTQDLLKMIESSCSETKAVVDNLLIIDPNQLVEATRKVTLNVNPLFSSVYQYISSVNNSTAESEYLMNISSLEHSLNDLITSVKEYMVQCRFGKSKEMIEEAKKNCEETIEDFLGILEKLRPTNQEGAKRKKDARASILLAKSTLGETISDLAQLSRTQVQENGDNEFSRTSESFYRDFDDIIDTIAS